MNTNGTILTFDCNRILAPANRFSHTGMAAHVFGDTTPLTFVAVRAGPYLLGKARADTGAFVLARGRQTLSPTKPNCRADGIGFIGLAAVEAAAGILPGVLVLDAAHMPDIAKCLDRLIAEIHSMPASEASALSYTLFCRLAALYDDSNDMPAGPSLAHVAAGEMRTHYADIEGIADLAKRLDVSTAHLIRTFRAAFGTTPGQFLTQIRIETAKRLLTHRALTLEIIAGLCGFSGANYFCKAFKAHTGETPTSWRARSVSIGTSDDDNALISSLYL